jgi:hypothetical protein
VVVPDCGSAAAVIHCVAVVRMSVGLRRVLASLDLGIRHGETGRRGDRERGERKASDDKAAKATPLPAEHRKNARAPIHLVIPIAPL